MFRNDGVTFWSKGDHTDGRPIPRMTCPASPMELLYLGVQGLSGSHNGQVFTVMTLLRRHVADATLLVRQVVPVHKRSTQLARRLQRLETLARNSGRYSRRETAIQHRRCHRSPACVSTKASPQPVEHGQHRGGLERGDITIFGSD